MSTISDTRSTGQRRVSARLLFLTTMVSLLPQTRLAAAPAGTLDQLVSDFDAKLDRALQGHDLRHADLALALRPGAGVSDRLTEVLRTLIKGKLAAKGLRGWSDLLPTNHSAQPAAHGGGAPPRPEEQARGAGFELLLDLELLVVEGHLHLRGQLLRTDRSLWRDTLQPDRGAVSHLDANVRIDAEVRAFQSSPAAAAVRFTHHTYPLGRGEILALGAGDLDGDGRADLLALGPRTLEVLKPRSSGGFVAGPRLQLASPSAPLRSRRPLGTLVVMDRDRNGRAEVFTRTGELEQGAEIVFDGKSLVTRKALAGYPLAAAASGADLILGHPVPGLDLFGADALVFAPAGVPAWQKQLPATFYTLRTAMVSTKTGRQCYAGVVDGGGQLQIFSFVNEAPIALGPKVGVALDLADLDDDGALEVIASSAEGPEADDQLLVFRLVPSTGSATAQLRPLWRSPGLGGRVVDLTHGDFEGNGHLEVVAVIRDRTGAMSVVVLN
jgi:hypothetical protein